MVVHDDTLALAVRGEIAVTGDMVPTKVLGLSAIDRSKGLPICTIKPSLFYFTIELLLSQRSMFARFHPAACRRVYEPVRF